MSYILDALKRAEAQRERGAVPGLNAQPTPLPAPERPVGSRQPLVWALAALLGLSLAGAAGWFWHGAAPTPPAAPDALAQARPAPASPGQASAVAPGATASGAAPAEPVAAPPAAPAAPATTTAPAAPAPAPALAPAPSAVPDKPVAAAAPAAKPAPASAPQPAKAAAPTAPAAAPTAKPAPAPTPAPAPVAAQAPARPAPPAPAPAPQAAAPAVKPPLLSELPADLRGQLPKMTINGAVYSKDPNQRLLLINNQVFTQGGHVAPGLDLEEIQPHSAIFNYQGTRFAMPH